MKTSTDGGEKSCRVLDISRRPFEYIAFWQFLTFSMLIALIWVNEIMDVTSNLYRLPPSRINWLGASVLTFFTILVGFITIAHTYVQQKRILKGIITICSYCKKVQIDTRAWERIESFVAAKTLAEFSHGICPRCYPKVYDEQMGSLRDTTRETPPSC